jgi:hypothetical protein
MTKFINNICPEIVNSPTVVTHIFRGDDWCPYEGSILELAELTYLGTNSVYSVFYYYTEYNVILLKGIRGSEFNLN